MVSRRSMVALILAMVAVPLSLVTGCARTGKLGPYEPIAMKATLDSKAQKVTVTIENRSEDTIQLHKCTYLTKLKGAELPSSKPCTTTQSPLAAGATVTESYEAYPPYVNPKVTLDYDPVGNRTQQLTVSVDMTP